MKIIYLTVILTVFFVLLGKVIFKAIISGRIDMYNEVFSTDFKLEPFSFSFLFTLVTLVWAWIGYLLFSYFKLIFI